MAVICGWKFISLVGKNPFSIENGKRIYATFLSLWLFCSFDSTVQIQFPTSVPIISCHHTIVHKIITVNSRYIIQPAHILISSESRQSLSFQMKFKKKTSEILNKSFFYHRVRTHMHEGNRHKPTHSEPGIHSQSKFY